MKHPNDMTREELLVALAAAKCAIKRLQRENKELRDKVASCQEELRLCQQDVINAQRKDEERQKVYALRVAIAKARRGDE